MTAHQLAQVLLSGPDLPVVINGWGSDEGCGPFEVTKTVTYPKPEEFATFTDGGKIWSTGFTLTLTY